MRFCGTTGAVWESMKTNAAKSAASYTVLDTITTSNPLKDARLFGAFLAADKGYSSEIVKISGGYDCVASDGRAIRFAFRPRIVREKGYATVRAA